MPHRLEEAVVKATVNQMLKSSLPVLVGNVVAAIVLGFYLWWLTASNFFCRLGGRHGSASQFSILANWLLCPC